jgi:hypothetical protein
MVKKLKKHHFIRYTNDLGQYKEEYFSTNHQCSEAFLNCQYVCFKGVLDNKGSKHLISKGPALWGMGGNDELLRNTDVKIKDRARFLKGSYLHN